MSFRIRPQGTLQLNIDDAGTGLSPLFDNSTYWPDSRTATLTIFVDPAATGYCCITNAEPFSARVINPGDIKTYGPFDRETFADMFLYAPVNAPGNELSVFVSLDEILSEY
jgi:hypothetical protein